MTSKVESFHKDVLLAGLRKFAKKNDEFDEKGFTTDMTNLRRMDTRLPVDDRLARCKAACSLSRRPSSIRPRDGNWEVETEGQTCSGPRDADKALTMRTETGVQALA